MSQRNRTTDELGAHVSAAGGVHNAPGRAADLDSVVLQLFTKQPGRWAEPVIGDDEVAAYRAAVGTHRIRAAAVHDSYLINLASPDPQLRARSIDCFVGELTRSAALGVQSVVTHPGNATDGDVASALARNAEAAHAALEQVPGIDLLFETTAGAGSVLGADFAQLAALIEAVQEPHRARVGVCFDTCHVWAAGYDLRAAYDDVMSRFDDVIGLERIRLFHLNDSLRELGSRRDRHAHIGDGALGHAPFRSLLRDDRFLTVPKLLETPKDGDALVADRRNLARLRGYRV